MMAVINPEVQKIQKKYKNKKDQASMMKQQEEIQQVYDKYGTSMMGGCLPLLIQMPFLFALYPVIYNIQQYVPAIKGAPAAVNRFITIPDLTVSSGCYAEEQWIIRNAGNCDHDHGNRASASFSRNTVCKYETVPGNFRTAADG